MTDAATLPPLLRRAPPAGYRGRFAPSPTGPLHAGSLLTALASWLDTRAHGGRWLVRIEDVDRVRCRPGTDRLILQQLAALGLHPDEPPQWQSQRDALYTAALSRLQHAGRVYPCVCSRSDIARRVAPGPGGERVYPGTCRTREPATRTPPFAWRLRVPSGDAALLRWQDRRLGAQQQALDREVGDFVLKRADGEWAYQLAVVVDDAEAGISDVVRGEDLADNTPRQIWLQQCLGLPTPRHWHGPLLRDAGGAKLSKQTGAPAVDTAQPLAALASAGAALGLQAADSVTPGDWLAQAVRQWQARWGPPTPAARR